MHRNRFRVYTTLLITFIVFGIEFINCRASYLLNKRVMELESSNKLSNIENKVNLLLKHSLEDLNTHIKTNEVIKTKETK